MALSFDEWTHAVFRGRMALQFKGLTVTGSHIHQGRGGFGHLEFKVESWARHLAKKALSDALGPAFAVECYWKSPHDGERHSLAPETVYVFQTGHAWDPSKFRERGQRGWRTYETPEQAARKAALMQQLRDQVQAFDWTTPENAALLAEMRAPGYWERRKAEQDAKKAQRRAYDRARRAVIPRKPRKGKPVRIGALQQAMKSEDNK